MFRPISTQRPNPLAIIGAPFFSLLIFLITAAFFLISFLLRVPALLWHRGTAAISLLDNLLASLPALPKPKRPKTAFRFPIPDTRFVVITILISTFSYYFYVQIFAGLPSPRTLTSRSQKLTTQILDRNGQLLFKIYQDENRTPIKLSSLPPYVKEAFLAIEDNGFYQHSGFSVISLLRATYHNLAKQKTEGGSTITQQLVKNALLSSEKTWQRKVKELILAIAVESIYDKDEILEMYLNEVGFGGPAYGIQEGAEQYFAVNARQLSIAQAAFLAGLPKAPSKYSPYINPGLALSRQNLVLSLMLKNGYLTANQFAEAVNAKLTFAPPKIEINAPHFVMYVRDLLVDQYSEELISHGGLKVTTSLDLNLQKDAETIISDELSRLTRLNVRNGALLITRPGTGEILAMVGSRNYFDLTNDGQVNLTTSLRQPGSSIKAVNYALAFEKGAKPNTTIKDEPISFNIQGVGLWTPKNYDGRFHGTLTLRQALANSYNIPAVLLLAKNGVVNMITLGQKMGITTWNEPARYGLSLTLGGAEVKMTDLATVYGTFANSGLTVPLNPIIKIESSQGKPIAFDPCLSGLACVSSPSVSQETAFFISDILSDNSARAAAFGYRSVLNLSPFKTAVKTGTSNDLRDNWTIGYTPDYVVAAWVGNNDNSPMSQVASGITGASPIWSKMMRKLLESNLNNTAFATPESLVRLPICTLTGTLTCSGCPTIYEYFIKGREPKTTCKSEDVAKILEERAKATTPTPTNQILTGTTTTR
ncbi:MAG: transglycosylase domain-containing protein [Patescibacteria group bacterium]